MGLPNEILVGRFNRLLNRLTAIKGGAPAPVLTPEILAVLSLEADRLEWAYLKGERLGIVRAQSAAVVAQFSGVNFQTTVGVLAVVEALWLFAPAGGVAVTLEIRNGGGGLAANGAIPASQSRDTRNTGALSSVLAPVSGAVPSSTIIARPTTTTQQGTGFFPIPFPYVMGPLAGLVVIGTTLNLALDVGVLWRERAIEESEV
jgi:hypothetical protein